VMPADDGRLHVDAGRTPSPAGLLFSPSLTTKIDNEARLASAAAVGDSRLAVAQRRLSPPLDDLNTPATFTPTFSCSHFVFDPVGDFPLITVDDLPTNGQ